MLGNSSLFQSLNSNVFNFTSFCQFQIHHYVLQDLSDSDIRCQKKTTQCQVGYKVTVRLWQSAWDCSGINTQGGTFTLACLWYLFLSNLKRKVMMIDESSVHTNNWFMYLSHWVFDFVVSINNKCKRHRRLICRVYATPPWSGFIIIWRVVSQMHWGSRIPVFFLLTHSVQGACVDTPLPPYPIRKAIV